MSDPQTPYASGQIQASERNDDEQAELQEGLSVNHRSRQTQSSTALPPLSKGFQSSWHSVSSSQGTCRRERPCRSALQLQEQRAHGVSKPHITTDLKSIYRKLPIKAADAGPGGLTDLRYPLGRISSGDGVQTLPASTPTRAIRSRRRLVDRTSGGSASPRPLRVAATPLTLPSVGLPPDEPLTNKTSSPPRRLWTDPMRTICRQPVLWTTNCRLLLSDTDIRFGNVISPCSMIGLPFAASSMIEVAHHYS